MHCPKCKAEHEKKLKECPSCGFNRFGTHKAKNTARDKNPSYWKYIVLPLFIYFAVFGGANYGSDGMFEVYGLGCFLFLILTAVHVTAVGRKKGLIKKTRRGGSSNTMHYSGGASSCGSSCSGGGCGGGCGG